MWEMFPMPSTQQLFKPFWQVTHPSVFPRRSGWEKKGRCGTDPHPDQGLRLKIFCCLQLNPTSFSSLSMSINPNEYN